MFACMPDKSSLCTNVACNSLFSVPERLAIACNLAGCFESDMVMSLSVYLAFRITDNPGKNDLQKEAGLIQQSSANVTDATH